MIISPFYGGEGGAYSSTAAEGGWGEHCTGLCKMVVDTAGKGMREGRNRCLGVGGWKGSNVYMLVALIVVVAEERDGGEQCVTHPRQLLSKKKTASGGT